MSSVIDCLRFKESAGGEPGRETGADPGPEPGLRPPGSFFVADLLFSVADVMLGGDEEALLAAAVGCKCCFLCFLRDVSVPEASERFGDPGRLTAKDDFLERSECFGRPEGVFVPFEEAPEGKFSPSLPFALSVPFCSSSFFRSSSLRRSVSESSESLCYYISFSNLCVIPIYLLPYL